MAELPEWMRSRDGGGALLVIAPHGGLSERDLLEPPPDERARSNDFHTAAVAAEIAERLDASLLANDGLDRNHLDLNRLGDVEARAPWFLEAIADRLERILARHAVADVVFVHGWHIVQPKCDIGVGALLASARDAEAAGARLTVPPEYVAERLEPLRVLCARGGIASAYGERWPAAHRENLVQLFRQASARHLTGAAARIAACARSGRARATQLELGAPLRWPGGTRRAFVDAVVASWRPSGGPRGFGVVAEDSGEAIDEHDTPRGESRDVPAGGFSLQACDPDAGEGGLGIAAAMGTMPDGRVGARLVLFPGGQRIVLFTGEEATRNARRVGGLEMESGADGALRLRFDGPALVARDGRRHFQSEVDQASARISELRADLVFAPLAGTFGELRGWVEIDGERLPFSAGGFTAVPPLRSPRSDGGPTIRVGASFGRDLGLALTVCAETGVDGDRFSPTGCERVREPLDPLLDCAVGSGAPFAVRLSRDTLSCSPRSHFTWLRPVAPRRYARITLGVASFALASGARGSGIYEHVEAVQAAVSEEAPAGDPSSEVA